MNTVRALKLYAKKNAGELKTLREIREELYELTEPGDYIPNMPIQMAKLGYEQLPNDRPNSVAPWLYKVPEKPGEKKTKITLAAPRKKALGRKCRKRAM